MTPDEILQGLYDNTLTGNGPAVLDLTHTALGMNMEPGTMLFDALIPALEEVGARFERGDFFVPEMLIAGKAMAGSMEVLRPLLADTGVQTIGKFLMGTVQGDVHDHVFLTTDHASFAQFDQDRAHVQSVVGRRFLGMAQEAGVHAGIAQRQRFAVHPHRAVLQRTHQIVGGVHQRIQIGAVLPAKLIRRGDKHLQRRVACACAHTGQTGIDTITTLFYRSNRVRHAKAQVVVGVHPGFCFRLQHRFQGAEAVTDIRHVHRPA